MNHADYNFIISSNISILQAMKYMDEIMRKLLIVEKENKFIGLLTLGDIQRAIINNHSMATPVAAIMRKDYIVAKPDQEVDEIKKTMLSIRAEFMPVIDEENNLIRVYFWNDLFGEGTKGPLFFFNIPVVVMAGGVGTRLRPLTNVFPKSLMPIKDKTIIEEIFDRFYNHGCTNFYISVNYKADLTEYYLKQQNLPYNLNFFREDIPLGTAGSLSLLKGVINETFFVSNCDILINQDYSEILKYHRANKNEITVVAALRHFSIQYGTIETGETGRLVDLVEKPEITLKINSGMYILESHLINEIPPRVFYHITDLIKSLRNEGRKVGVFPVSEKSWTDIGTMTEYVSLIK
ncbi:MAG TPA: sugar phosphate nucleotidyltransferase [Bacteroidales bacterium]|nr:sugar phosphate nucleotidyltransferase [Bacteroidales bacterium]